VTDRKAARGSPGRVAIVTDSGADLPPERAAAAGISVVPLVVRFDEAEYRDGVDLSTEDFWRRLSEPKAPFPRTAAPSAEAFRAVFEERFKGGASSIVCITLSGDLSATLGSARIARQELPDREIHLIDSRSASMGVGMLAEMAVEQAAEGASGAEIYAALAPRVGDLDIFVVLETLEFLRRGGRLNPARAAIGSVLSIKPIITVTDGRVETAETPRTRGKARERLFDLLCSRPMERLAVLHSMAPGAASFAEELTERAGLEAEAVSVQLIGPTVGSHIGPGAFGAVVLRPQA